MTYTLSIHLIGGQTMTLHVTGYEITPPQIDEHGHVVSSMAIAWTPVDETARQPTYIAYGQVSAVEVEQHGSAEE